MRKYGLTQRSHTFETLVLTLTSKHSWTQFRIFTEKHLHIHFFPFVFLSKLEIKIWDFISLFPDLTALTPCALVSVIKQSRLQVMDTSARIPTGSKRKRNISQLSALFHCLPRNDLLITYKTLPGLSRATFLFSIHSWKLLFSHPIDRVQKAMGLSVSWITFISFYKSPYYCYYMSLSMGFFVPSLFFFFYSSAKMRA